MAIINILPEGSAGIYTPYGGCKLFLESRDWQVIIYGGTGSGKTTSGCYKMLMLCLKYPGCKFLFTRKSYRALVKSGVETFQRVVHEAGHSIGKKTHQIRRHGDKEPTEFTFPYARRTDDDGKVYEGESRILLASLDRVKDELGSEYDYVYVNQPEQCTEEDWQYLASRADGRYDHAPFPQIYGDPNPEHAHHWIKKYGYELEAGQTPDDGRWRLIKSTYRDNPILWNHKLDCFTPKGEERIARLRNSMSPVMVKRLIESEWASFEGLVYGEVWNREDHTISLDRWVKDYPLTDEWPRYWAIDWGYDHPFVCSMWAKHPEKELYIRYKLIYMSERTVLEHAQTIINMTAGEPKPKLIVADRNPGETILLSQAIGMHIVTAKKGPDSIKARVNVVTDMLKNKQLLFMDDALVEEDPRMVAAKRPTCFEEEVVNLRRKQTGLTPGELPIEGDDHEENAIGYLFAHIKASQRTIPFIWE